MPDSNSADAVPRDRVTWVRPGPGPRLRVDLLPLYDLQGRRVPRFGSLEGPRRRQAPGTRLKSLGLAPSLLTRLDLDKRLEREHVGDVRVDAALEDLEVCALDRLEPVPAADIEPAAGPLAERVPRVGHPLLEPGAAPVLGALDDAVGSEEEG